MRCQKTEGEPATRANGVKASAFQAELRIRHGSPESLGEKMDWLSIIADEVDRKGFYKESVISLINGRFPNASSTDDILEIAKSAGLVVRFDPWKNPRYPKQVDYIAMFYRPESASGGPVR